MKDILTILVSGVIVYIIVYPITEWIRKVKEEMEEEKNGQSK
jgi:predicted PurR-regulated permease PerM